MMTGASTLSRGGHVHGDFPYRLWQLRTQAKVDLVLHISPQIVFYLLEAIYGS